MALAERFPAAQETEKSGRAPEDTVCWEDVRDFVLAGSVPQMPPVSAAVGGILAQEVLKVSVPFPPEKKPVPSGL